MSASVDVNVLVYASDTTQEAHETAIQLLRQLATGRDLLYLTWPAVVGYLRVTTHPKIFQHPLTPETAEENITRLLEQPRVRLLGPTPDGWTTYRSVTRGQHVRGNLVPDAHIAAVLRHHGVRRLYTRDRDFRRFDFLEVIDPF